MGQTTGQDELAAKGTDRLTPDAEAVFARELPIIEASLKRLLKSLDTRVEPCCSCGLKVSAAYNDLRAAETFRGTLNKIQAYSRRLRAHGVISGAGA